MRSTILSGLAVLLVLTTPVIVRAQAAHPDSVQRRNNCRLAAQVLTTGHPAARKSWALSYIGFCPPPEKAAVLRVALPRAAADADLSTFQRLASSALYVPDDQLLDMLLAVATTGTTSERIRLAALVNLDLFRNPGRVWLLEELMQSDGSDCPTAFRMHPFDFAPFRPEPTAFLPRLNMAVSALAADSTQPVTVRRLAQCMM